MQPVREGLEDPADRHAAGKLTGLLWLIGGISGALWYLVPGAATEHWRLGLGTASFSAALGIACLAAPWRRMRPEWIYAAAGLALVVIPIVMALNGGADSPTVLYLFMASALFGYYLPTRLAVAFLAVGVLVPATPMLYDPEAREPIFIARYVLTAPIYAGVGLAVVLAKRQLVASRNESRDQALRDPLTGMPNRRALTHALREAAADPHLPRPLALVMIDLDDFKLANTLYGYVGGDRVLCRAAETLRNVTRPEDLIARVGGDEFAMLVYGSPEPDLARLAQRIVEGMRDAELDLPPTEYRLTASVGFAILAAQGEEVDDLLDSADRELRRAKRAGKNRWDAAGIALAG
jgi:diguanylate cyclase (GGDEF)-like protein